MDIYSDWLNRGGLTLQLVALFLVTPEILGASRLRTLLLAARQVVASVLPVLSVLAGILLGNSQPDLSALQTLAAAVVLVVVSLPVYLTAHPVGRHRTKQASFLAVGAWTFVLGYVMLMIATFHPGATV